MVYATLEMECMSILKLLQEVQIKDDIMQTGELEVRCFITEMFAAGGRGGGTGWSRWAVGHWWGAGGAPMAGPVAGTN